VRPPLITSTSDAVENIHRLTAYLSQHPGDLEASLRSVRRWYAAWDRKAGWLLGFSKFIGYQDMTGERYWRSIREGNPDREALDGRRTEGQGAVLRLNATEIDEYNPIWPELSDALGRFLRSQGLERPRKDATIRTFDGYGKK